MKDNEAVQLTELGHKADISSLSNPEQDVIVRLRLFEKQGISPLTVEDLGYELKMPAIKTILAPLAKLRYLTIEEVYPPRTSVVGALQAAAREGDRKLGLGVAPWKCPICGAGNIASSSDPKRVTCYICGKSLTVTGRNIDGTLIVRQLKVR